MFRVINFTNQQRQQQGAKELTAPQGNVSSNSGEKAAIAACVVKAKRRVVMKPEASINGSKVGSRSLGDTGADHNFISKEI